MKKLRTSILALFIFHSVFVYGQVPVNFNDCNYDMFFVSADTKPMWNVDTLSQEDYFNNYFADIDEIKGINGKVILGIIIFETGKTCCHSFTDMTKSNLNPEIFKDAVNDMADWVPAKQQDKEIVFLLHLVLDIENGKFIDKNKLP